MFTFRAMSTDVNVTAGQAEAERVADTFWRAEARFSRFLEGSELSVLNRARGPIPISKEMFFLLERARSWVERTGGLFDPAVGGVLCSLGYDRSFAPGALDRDRAAPLPRRGSLLELRLDADNLVAERPEHLQIDLGGIAKASTLDEAARHLEGAGSIEAGGDAVLRGSAPGGGEWLIDLEDPTDAARVLATVIAPSAAVATSAANRRFWRLRSSIAHHLIDPRTRAPAKTDLAQATVFAQTAEEADVLAKTAFLLGERAAPLFLSRFDAAAVLVRSDRSLAFCGRVEVVHV